MALLPGHIENFRSLQRASEAGDLALMECTDAKTGKPTAVVCMVNRAEDGKYEFVPVARLFDGNPYAELLPPIP